MKWDERKLAILMEAYPVEPSRQTALRLGMSESAVKRKARQLGLSKLVKSRWLERAGHIRSHFTERSYSEMARELGITKATVSRIAARIGLKRTRAQAVIVRKRTRIELIRKERRRVVFGLEPVTRLKVVSNRARVRLRSRLKQAGYIVGRERNVAYYATEKTRKTRLEAKGAKLGFRFLPLQERDDNISPTTTQDRPCDTER